MSSKDKYIKELETVRDTMLEAYSNISEQIDNLKAQNKELIGKLTEANRKVLTYENLLGQAELAYNKLKRKNK